jgi:diguanylate cyclase (GGDEF)-like protein/PAS domain S-box-containing protein
MPSRVRQVSDGTSAAGSSASRGPGSGVTVGVLADDGRGHEDLVSRLVADVEDYAILLLDLTGNVVTWNAGARRLKGYQPEEIIGRHFSVFYPSADVAAGKPARELEIAAAEGRVEDEGWRVRQDGTRFWANVVITALRDRDGTLRGYGKITRNLGGSDHDDSHTDLTRDYPDEAAAGYGVAADDRDRTADDRDRRAGAHDVESEARDKRSTARDRRADARERAADLADTGSVADRAGGSRDRNAAANDRSQSADDRKAASVDRGLAARDRASASIDELTNTYRRDAGTVELRRELARAERMKQRFVLAFVDLDNLKATNDSLGHAAGDQRLRQTADLIRSHFRPYDLIVRFGGDEFASGLPGMTAVECAERFSLANADLIAARQPPVTVGLAERESEDSLEDLIVRADASLYNERGAAAIRARERSRPPRAAAATRFTTARLNARHVALRKVRRTAALSLLSDRCAADGRHARNARKARIARAGEVERGPRRCRDAWERDAGPLRAVPVFHQWLLRGRRWEDTGVELAARETVLARQARDPVDGAVSRQPGGGSHPVRPVPAHGVGGSTDAILRPFRIARGQTERC